VIAPEPSLLILGSQFYLPLSINGGRSSPRRMSTCTAPPSDPEIQVVEPLGVVLDQDG
jgi:hypothetical protein